MFSKPAVAQASDASSVCSVRSCSLLIPLTIIPLIQFVDFFALFLFSCGWSAEQAAVRHAMAGRRVVPG